MLAKSTVCCCRFTTAIPIGIMNSGEELKYDIIVLPEFIDMNKKEQEKPLHIYGINADKFSDEPIVIEIKW